MKLILFLLILFTSACLDAQVQEFKDQYPNGKTRSEGNYVNGFEEGLWKYYYDTGTLQEESNYKKGKLNGSVKRYHANGKLMVDGYFRMNEQDSIQRTYSAEGKLVEEGYFTKGSKTGRWNYFFPTGDTLMVEEFRNGEELLWVYCDANKSRTVSAGNGIMEEKLDNGKTLRSSSYKNGRLDGVYLENYNGSSPRIRGNYKEGKEDG